MNIEERFKVYVFDFDGTLTDTDTLLLFIKYVFKGGKTKCGKGWMKVERVERIGNKGVERC